MASTNTLQIIENGQRNAIIRATQVSDGNADTVTIYNATSSGSFGVSVGGQVFYPGIHTTITGLMFDVQDTKIRLRWEATADTDILALGASPETFDFKPIGGLRVPVGLTGATGSIKVVTIDPLVNATYSVILMVHKNVPQS